MKRLSIAISCLFAAASNGLATEGMSSAELQGYGLNRPVAPGEPGDVAAYDANDDDQLDRVELKTYYLKELAATKEDATDKKADDFAVDVITSCSQCTDTDKVPFNEARIIARFYVDRGKALKEIKEFRIGWKGLGFKRFVVDSASPRSSRFEAPLVLSYRRNVKAAKHDQFILLGGIQLYEVAHDLESTGRSIVTASPGVDLDVDTGKKSSDSSIVFGLPLYYRQIWHPNSLLESVTVALAPKFGTDRAFDREVLEGTVGITPTSSVLQAGYIWPRAVLDDFGNRPWISISWLPTFQIEAGDVRDAAGNEKLEKIKKRGAYARLTPRIDVSLYPWRISERIAFQYQYFQRYDVTGGKAYPYGEARFLYDLTFGGLIQFSIIYRNGRQPPDFQQSNDLLIGLGVKQ